MRLLRISLHGFNSFADKVTIEIKDGITYHGFGAYAPIEYLDNDEYDFDMFIEELQKILPHENFIYYADTRHLPYGDKSKEEIISYSEYIVKYFIENDDNDDLLTF